ncbi:hypothetical protein GCM10029992_44130 [Glycomyces albus]
MLRCPFCGWPEDHPVTTVSVHPTPSGVTMWTRCACGSLQTRVLDGSKAVVTARSRPAKKTAAV